MTSVSYVTPPIPAPRPRARHAITRHTAAKNFASVPAAASAPVSVASLARLISMLDCEHEPNARYAVVCKRVSCNRRSAPGSAEFITTVLDVPLNRIYRASSPSGLAALWRGIAARSKGAVQYVPAAGVYVPDVPPERVPREQWYLAHRGADN